MARSKRDPLRSLIDAPGVREAAQALIEAVRAAGESELSPKAYERALRRIASAAGATPEGMSEGSRTTSRCLVSNGAELEQAPGRSRL